MIIVPFKQKPAYCCSECVGYWNDYNPYRDGDEDLHRCRLLGDVEIEELMISKSLHPNCPIIEIPKYLELELYEWLLRKR